MAGAVVVFGGTLGNSYGVVPLAVGSIPSRVQQCSDPNGVVSVPVVARSAWRGFDCECVLPNVQGVAKVLLIFVESNQSVAKHIASNMIVPSS